MTPKFIEKHYDEFLHYYYNSPCCGCGDGHPSFWKTVIESPQWKKWSKEINRRMKIGKIVNNKFNKSVYDMSEVEELGIISPGHFQEFLKFCKKNKLI